MQSQNRMFDDFVKMMNGAAGTFAGMGREAENSMRDKMREWVGGMDMVGRDEFEAVKAMAAAARLEILFEHLDRRADGHASARARARSSRRPMAAGHNMSCAVCGGPRIWFSSSSPSPT